MTDIVTIGRNDSTVHILIVHGSQFGRPRKRLALLHGRVRDEVLR